jgi:hypothetical protein
MVANNVCHILYIEENTDDLFLFQRAFEKSEIPCVLHIVDNLPDAVLYLKGEAPYTDRDRFPFPSLIVTDFADHIGEGVRFIHWLRSVPALADVQLICLSGTEDPLRVDQIRQLAVTFIPKAALFDDLMTLIRTILPI